MKNTQRLIESAVRKIVRKILREALWTPDQIQESIDFIKKQLEGVVPVFTVSKSSLGGTDIYLLVCFQPRNEWAHGIMENSNYFRMRIEMNGTMEEFTRSLYQKGARAAYETRLPVKFRKTKAKDVKDAAKKLLAYIELIKSHYE